MNKIEMSTVDPHLPKYYKGFDIDILTQKLLDKRPLTDEEKNVLGEAQEIYYKKYFEESRKKWEELKKTEPGKWRKTVSFFKKPTAE